VVKAGPEAAGFQTACWTTVLIQQFIYQEFGVLYSWQYVADLLHNLGFSYKAGQVLTTVEMQEMLRALELCLNPRTCPYSRPTMIHMSVAQLAREFGRSE